MKSFISWYRNPVCFHDAGLFRSRRSPDGAAQDDRRLVKESRSGEDAAGTFSTPPALKAVMSSTSDAAEKVPR